MNKFNNIYGHITDIGKDFIEIDSVKYTISSNHALTRISKANPRVGDSVEFNLNSVTREIIFLKNLDKKFHRVSKNKYVEDPRDPDEVHDMEAVYGHDFEGM